VAVEVVAVTVVPVTVVRVCVSVGAHVSQRTGQFR
jgi:hypothetical protein